MLLNTAFSRSIRLPIPWPLIKTENSYMCRAAKALHFIPRIGMNNFVISKINKKTMNLHSKIAFKIIVLVFLLLLCNLVFGKPLQRCKNEKEYCLRVSG